MTVINGFVLKQNGDEPPHVIKDSFVMHWIH